MRILKRVGLLLLIVFIVIQFFRPERNINKGETHDSIGQLMVPVTVHELLQKACYDCHSNNTSYPWYVNIQPVSWFLADHIRNGKKDLNFDEFGSYPARRQLSKLKSIAGSLGDGTMPISSYTLLHREARLTAKEKEQVINWALQTKDSLEAAK